MIECPICQKSFELEQAVIYQEEEYCSVVCAAIAAQEGKNTSEPVEAEKEA